MASHWDSRLSRYVRDCEALPDHAGVPSPGHVHEFFLRRDYSTGAPKEAVVWAVWDGGFRELRTWPATRQGLAEAQAWCDEHGAVWRREHYPVQPGSLAEHADAGDEQHAGGGDGQ